MFRYNATQAAASSRGANKHGTNAMHKILIFATLVISAASAQAAPVEQFVKPGDPLEPTPWGGALGVRREGVPADVLDQFSGQQIVSLSQAVLTARSAELRDRLIKSPGNAAVLHALGSVTYQQGGIKEAIALWSAAHKREPNLAPAEVMRDVQEVFTLQAKGDATGARNKLLAAEKRYARQPHFQLIRAEQAARGGNLTAAEAAYRLAYQLAPKLYVTSLNLARFYDVARPDPAAAERMFQRAAKLAPKRPEVWAHLGAFQYRQKQTRAALASLRRARSLDPAAALPERRLAELSVMLSDYAAARQWYRSALDTHPPAAEELRIRAALGDVLLRLNRLDEARKEIEAVLKTQETPPLVFALATVDEAQGKLDAAERRYRRVLQLMPNNPLPANNLAMLLLRAGKSADEALRLAEQARRALPNNAIVESTYGCALSHAGRNREAVTVLEPVLKATPKDAWAHYCLGRSLLLEKNPSEATTHLAQVLQLDPKFPLRTQLEKMLADIR